MASSMARWATCALALSILVPAAMADRGAKKSLADCTYFDQRDKGDDKVEMTIKNLCTVPVDCTMSWRVVCAPDSKKRRSVHPSSVKVSLDSGASDSKEASAAQCGDDAFAIDSIQWACQPNAD
jgi:hypothetical protein